MCTQKNNPGRRYTAQGFNHKRMSANGNMVGAAVSSARGWAS